MVPEATAVAARCAAEEAASEVEGADASAAEEVSRAENDDLMLSADSSDDDDDEVIEIRGQKGRGSRLRYLVLWSDKSETWEPRRNLNGCVDKLKDFLDNGSQGPSVALSPYELDRLARIRRNEEEAARFDVSSLPNSAEFDTIDSPSAPLPAACPPTLSPTFSDQSDDDLLHQPDGDLLPPGTQPNAAHKHPQLTTPPSTPRSKRNQCSPAIGSPAEQPPAARVRSSPRFSALPGAEALCLLSVGDRVKAIWKYKENQTDFHQGTVQAIADDGTYTIQYKDGDVEFGVSRSVIIKFKTNILDPAPMTK